ncbi:hypothetical protein IJH89_02825 [Candidatus Saccharibacteria bacterium]|nr:hypothetical protein [Candidatus Saccharibacteria bacterium]
MKISDIYIGGWFQRTMLQLSEIYDFLRGEKTVLKLSEKKLDAFRDRLEIASIEYGISGEEYILLSSNAGVSVKIFEDGLIVLHSRDASPETLLSDVEKLQSYYETRLSPAFSYLFSLGAPVPKELANIKNVYPYFIILDNAAHDDMVSLLESTDRKKYFEFKTDKYDVVRGDKFYFINRKSNSIAQIERYIEEQIFIREFKGQLHRYLNIHRILWEKIDEVKAHKRVRGSEIIEFATKLEAYAKTINLIDGRIKQMSTYLPTRERIAKEDKGLTEFLEISGYRYETLGDTLKYITFLWEMTKNYVENAQKQFDGLKADVTSKSVDSLTVVTSMSAGAAIIGLLQSEVPEFTTSGLIYVAILIVVGYSANKILSLVSNKQKYDVTDVEYEKNIK